MLRQGFHIPPEFHALVYAALGRELHHGEGCDVQLMVEALTDSVNPTDDIKKIMERDQELAKGWGQIVPTLYVQMQVATGEIVGGKVLPAENQGVMHGSEK